MFVFRLIPVSWDTKKKTIFVSLLPDLAHRMEFKGFYTNNIPLCGTRQTFKHFFVINISMYEFKYPMFCQKNFCFLLITIAWDNKIWKIYMLVLRHESLFSHQFPLYAFTFSILFPGYYYLSQ